MQTRASAHSSHCDSESAYDHSIYEFTNAETTPSQRIIEGKVMSEAAKIRVDEVPVRLCPIENKVYSNRLRSLFAKVNGWGRLANSFLVFSSPTYPTFHLVRQARVRLEHGTLSLNVDTRYNVLRRMSFYCIFLPSCMLMSPPISGPQI